MKAVVVDIKNNYAAILSEDGIIITIKNNNYEIGQVIQLNHRKASYTKKLMMIAASAAVFVILSAGTWVYASPYLYVSVDVNPSIEYTVNRFDRVLKVNAVNDDGKVIIDQISLKNLENISIESAITKTVQQIKKAGYFKSNTENGIVITTASENESRADELADDLHTIVTQEVSDSTEEDMIEAYRVGLTRVEEAKELGVTPGKLNLVEKLQSYAANSAEINIEEWLSKPVSDIMKATKEYKAATAASGSTITSEETASSTKSNKEDKLQEKEDQKLNKEDKINKTQNHSENSKADQASGVKNHSKAKMKNSNQDKRSTYTTLKKNESVNSKYKHPKDKTAKQPINSTGQKPNNRSHSNKSSKSDKTVNSDDVDRQSDHKVKSDHMDSKPGNADKSYNSLGNDVKSDHSDNKTSNTGKSNHSDNKPGNTGNFNNSNNMTDNSVKSDITDNIVSDTVGQTDDAAGASDDNSGSKDNPGNNAPGSGQGSSSNEHPNTGRETR